MLLASSLASCARPTEAECSAAIDRYVDMTLGDDPDVVRAAEENRPAMREAKKVLRRAEPRYKGAVARCVREVRRSELECAMNAEHANAWEACIE
jgi:hypothetical protein